jgi:peptidylprolyl isomerase
MKIPIAVIGLCLATVPLACGGGGSPASEESPAISVIAPSDPPFAAVFGGEGDRPTIDPPDRPPPKEVLVRDLELGSGPVAKRGDEVAVHYIGFEYETGEEKYSGSWPPYPPSAFRLGSGGGGGPFESGIEGMKVGGLREVVIPPNRLYGPGGTDYIVDLVRIKSDSERPPQP